MSGRTVQPQTRIAAIYARVSSERQRQEQTIDSQIAGLRELAATRGLLIAEELVFCDDGVSGASLQRPALERLRDRASEGAFEVLLCHSPDRLARRYVYQVLLLEELARAGVNVQFAREGERSDSPEDELLRQFQGMIAEYERAQIAERTRRGKLHRARQGSPSTLSCAPYGYRYVKKTEHAEALFEVDAVQAEVVREIFRRYTEQQQSLGEIARWLTAQAIPTRHGKPVWDRSTVWAMVRNPAYRGQAAFGRTRLNGLAKKTMRPTRMRGERYSKHPSRTDRPPEEWTLIPVPALISDEQFELAQIRLADGKRFSPRNTKRPTLLQGLLVCGQCGYAVTRTSARRKNGRTIYYRCTGTESGYPRGKVCDTRQIRAEELDELVWSQVTQLIRQPELLHKELERRLQLAQNNDPGAQRAEALEQQLTHTRTARERLIEAYQEQLITLEDLRERMPALHKREQTTTTQLDALNADLRDSAAYLRLAETLEGFLGRLDDRLEQLTTTERQQLTRLIVREVVVHGNEDKVTIKHSIPTPPPDPNHTPTQGPASSNDRLRGNGLDRFRARS